MSVRIETDGPVWTIIHSRPEARNAMNPENATALYKAFRKFDADQDAQVAVFWGEGGAFCAGYDLKRAALQTADDSLAAHNFPEQGEAPQAPMGPSRLDLSKPVIAAIAGPAVAGGMELAMWADMRVMEETAFMGVYCRRWGVPLIDGGTVRLPRLVGEGRAMDLILTGRRVDAAECAAIGLCEYLTPEGKAREKAEEIAHALTKLPQSCMNADRRSVRAQHGLSEREALRQEWVMSSGEFSKVGAEGAGRFAGGKGRGGDFSDL
jgi:enoyl-CoA hydratase